MDTSEPSPILAYSYLRFSSPAQADGDSIRRQTSLRDAWLKRHPNVRLDTSLTFADKGVSGFRGEHRTKDGRALKGFLDLVQRGRVQPGSILLIENMDRLSREKPVVAVNLLSGLLMVGVRVVQLAPDELELDEDSDLFDLFRGQMSQARGHDESKRKSGLCGEAWTDKKEKARNGGKPHGKAVPAWLELVSGEYRVKEDAARAVRLIFRWCAEGLGTSRVAQRLEQEKVPHIARGQKWGRTYVDRILHSRAALGEYQPMKGHKKRVPDGDPIPAYFPPVVTEAEWHAAHQAIAARNRRCGRPGKGKGPPHLFSGFIFDARDRCPLYVIRRWSSKHLVSARAQVGEAGATWCQFPLDVFTDGILSKLQELQATDLFDDPGAGKVGELEGRLGEVERRLTVATEKWEADPESLAWQTQVDRADKEKRALLRELVEARQQAAHPLSATWTEAVRLMAEDDPQRLRQALLETISEVWVLTLTHGQWRLAAAQVWFKDRNLCRSYLLGYRPSRGDVARVHPAESWVRSFADAAMPGDLDLRIADHAARLEGVLQTLDLS